MAYDLQLVQVNANIGGWSLANTPMGFPITPFDTLVLSMWTCLPISPVAPLFTASNGGPAYVSFLNLDAAKHTTLSLGSMQTSSTFYSATFDTPGAQNVRSHHLISVNCASQTVQYYLNDQVAPVLSGGWTSTGHFQSRTSINIWDFDIGSGFGTIFPAFADLWVAATPAFLDLAVEANRRKFTNAGVTPIDFGVTGTVPMGFQPQIYQTVRAGGVANDMLTNRGTGGGTFHMSSPYFVSLQEAGVCTLLPPLAQPSCAALWTRDTVPPFERVF